MNSGSFSAFQNSGGDVFGVKNLYINSLSGHYAEESCFDFYIATYNNIEGTTPVLNKIFAFNSYSISDSYIGKSDNTGLIKLAIANFWTGTAGGGSLIGDKFPLFIRVIGYLQPSYMTNVKKLAIFFDNLDYFSSLTSNGIDVVDCSSSLGSTTKCYGYKGQKTAPLLLNSLHNLNRIEIDVESLVVGTSIASPFQILIPMKSIENVGTINLQFATLTTDYFYGVYKSYTTILNTFDNFYQASYTSKTWASVINTGVITNINYRLSFSTSPTVGQTASTSPAIINCGHDDANPATPLVNYNAAPYYGAGFTYISDYDMIGNGFLASGSLINTKITSEKCISFSYTYLTSPKYGFFCPFSSNSVSQSTYLTALNFIYPYQNGQRIVDNTYGLWSDKTGDLISYQWHDNTGGLELFTQGFITLVNGGMTPPLYIGVNNQKIKWTFKTSNPIPINGRVVVVFSNTAVWTFGVDITEKCLLSAKLLANDRQHSCSISIVNNRQIIFTFAATSTDLSPFPAGEYSLIQYGVSKDGSSGLTLSFTLKTLTQNTYLIDQSSNLAGNMNFDNGANSYNLAVSNVILQTRTQGFRDLFQFDFSVRNKPIYFNEKIYIDIGILASGLIQSQVSINIKEGNSLSLDWLDVDLSNFNQIELIPRADINTLNKVYTVILAGIYIPTTNTPGLTLTLKHKTSLVLSSTTNQYPSFSTSYNGTLISPKLTLFKQVNGYGEKLELTFQVFLENGFASNHTILVILPIQYNPRGFCSCRVNGSPISCYYPRDYAIIMEGIIKEVPVNTTFNVTIYGILNPLISSLNSQATFLIGFNQTYDASLLTFFGEVSDVLSQNTAIGSLVITEAVISSSFVLAQTNFTFVFDYFPIDFSANTSLIFDIQDYESYGNLALKSEGVTCKFIELISGKNFINNCELFGLRLHFLLNDFINKSNIYSLTIENFSNPEYINCNIRKPSISYLGIDYKTVLYRTNPTTSNFPTFLSKENSSLQYSSWRDSQNKIYVHGTNFFKINIGMISPIIYLVPNSKPFSHFMGLSPYKPSNMSFWPTILQSDGIKVGDKKYGFRIGCPQNMSEQILDYLVLKTEPYINNLYANFQQISLNLVKKKYRFQPQMTEFKIANLGRALPVIFDLTEYAPIDYLLVKFNIVYSGLDLGHVFEANHNNSITFNITMLNPIVKLQVISTKNNTIDYAVYGQMTMDILSGNTDSYDIFQSAVIFHTVEILNTTVPILSILYEAVGTKPNEEDLLVTVSEVATIYCSIVISLSDSPTRDIDYVRKKADEGYKLSKNDRYQEQFLALYIQEFSSSTIFKISGLKSKKSYNFVCWAMNLIEKYSNPSKGKFTMSDNGGKIMRFGLTFAQEISDSSKQDISCYLCMYFAVPCQK